MGVPLLAGHRYYAEHGTLTSTWAYLPAEVFHWARESLEGIGYRVEPGSAHEIPDLGIGI